METTEQLLALRDYLYQYISDQRRELIETNIHNRTRFLSVGLEDIYQPQNASAVLRTADCFGIQDLHIVENHNTYRLNPGVALGAENWISLHKYNHKDTNNTEVCINHLKESGYRVMATSPHRNDVDLPDLDLDQKTVLFFGNEKDGLSDTVMDMADGYVKIPMYGFTESFNISVSAAICLHYLSEKLRKERDDWQLTEAEKVSLQLNWLKHTIRTYDSLVKDYKEKLS